VRRIVHLDFSFGKGRQAKPGLKQLEEGLNSCGNILKGKLGLIPSRLIAIKSGSAASKCVFLMCLLGGGGTFGLSGRFWSLEEKKTGGRKGSEPHTTLGKK